MLQIISEVAVEIRHEAIVVNVRRINRTERTTATITIKRIIIIITIVAIDDTIIGGVVLFSVAENRVKTGATVAVTEASTIFTDFAGICFKLCLFKNISTEAIF